jgi:hypothetical protein
LAAQNYFDFTTNTPYAALPDLSGWDAGTPAEPVNGSMIGVSEYFLDIADGNYPGFAKYSEDRSSWDYYPQKGGAMDGISIVPRSSDGAYEVAPGMFATTEYVDDVLADLRLGDYVVDSVRDGTTWHRMYKSGWVEQGAVVTLPAISSAGASVDFNLPIAMSDTNGCILTSRFDPQSGWSNYMVDAKFANNSKVTVYGFLASSSSTAAMKVKVFVSGMSAAGGIMPPAPPVPGNIDEYIGNPGDLVYDPPNKTIRVLDGQTPGGTRLAKQAELATASLPSLARYFSLAFPESGQQLSYTAPEHGWFYLFYTGDSGNGYAGAWLNSSAFNGMIQSNSAVITLMFPVSAGQTVSYDRAGSASAALSAKRALFICMKSND